MTPAPSQAVENAARLGRKGNMVAVEGNPRCRQHAWERRLEVHEGTECVVAVCVRCGTRELCWSRRPLAAEAKARLLAAEPPERS